VSSAESASDPNAELRRHPGWWVRLTGDALDLQTLATSVRLPTLKIGQLDARYYLRADDFQDASPEQSRDVERRGEEILRVLNGAARIEHDNSHAVHVEAATIVHSDGRIQNFAHLSATVEARSRVAATVTKVGQPETVEPPESLIDRLAMRGLGDADVERALRIFGRDDADYRDLYYVFEIAEGAIGAEMFANGTVTQAEINRFKHTAQSPTALGDAARHGREQQKPPANPMSLEEARDLIRRVVSAWLLP
jgi:hypothetical protein